MFTDYDEYMNSPEWFAKREQVIVRCNGTCEDCKAKKVEHVHHLTYERFGDELLEDLQGLCLDCHQAKHPNRKLKRDWLLLSDICKRLNFTIPALKRVLKQEGLVEKTVISYNQYDANTAELPSEKARKKMAKKKPGKYHSGRRGSYVWDFDLVKQLLEHHEVPQKGEYKVELPDFMNKPTKTEEYNTILGEFGLSTTYNKQSGRWEIKQDNKILATFVPSKQYGGYGLFKGQVRSVKVPDGFNGFVRLLQEHGIIQRLE